MSTSSRRRVGFTLVELLVVITIIGMLAALLLPAIGAVRARMHQSTCLNNLRQLGQALINDSSSKGNLPGYIQPVKRTGPAGQTYVEWTGSSLSDSGYISTGPVSVPANRLRSRISWAAILLPRLERQDIWDRMIDGTVSDPVRKVEVFICPVDTDANSSPDNAALSYVANTGAWDWDNSGNYLSGPGFGDTTDNGVFQNLTDGRSTSRIEGVTDGAATTLMLSENIHKDTGYSWLGVPMVPSALPIAEHSFGMVWVVNVTPQQGSPGSLDYQEGFSKEQNGSFESTRPRYVRPASTHPTGTFNVIFVDGHGTNLRADIDYITYQQLITANGRKSVDPQGWAPIPANGAIYQFRAAPPLSEKDFN